MDEDKQSAATMLLWLVLLTKPLLTITNGCHSGSTMQ